MILRRHVKAALIPLIVAAGLLFCVPTVQAGPSGSNGPQGGRVHGFEPGIAVEELDKNNDGRITQDEIELYIDTESVAVDADKNGKVSITELRALEERRREARLEKRYRSMDADQNGVVSVEEYRQALKSCFEYTPGDPGRPGMNPRMHGAPPMNQ